MPHADPEQRRSYARELYKRKMLEPAWREKKRLQWRSVQRSQKSKKAQRLQAKLWRLNNPERFLEIQRKAHGIYLTAAEYRKMLLDQQGLCAICGNPERRKRNGKITRLQVDHNHSTGKVRGLLCSACNTALGLLGESVERICGMIEYLRQYEPASIWGSEPEHGVPVRCE